jgi:hypothetical protein
MNKVAGLSKVIKGVAGNVVTKVVEVIKKEDTIMETKTNDVAEVTVNDVNAKEDVTMKEMTKADIRVALKEAGVTMSDSAFRKTKKAELLAQLEQYLEPEEDTVIATDEEMAADFREDMIDAKIDAEASVASIDVGDLSITKDNAPDIEEPEKKGGDDMKVRNRRLLLNLLCYRWVAENRLFFKSNKYREEGGDFYFIASRKRQLGVTCKVIKDLGWQANPTTLDRVAEILREEGIKVSDTRDVYIPTAIWDKFTKGKAFLDKKKGDKDIVAYLKEVI